MTEQLNEYFLHVKTLVDSIETDSTKASAGNKAAGVRLRKSLRYLKNITGDYINVSLGKETKHELVSFNSEES